MAQVQMTGSRRAPRRPPGSSLARRSRAMLRRPAQLPSLRLRPVSDHRPKYEPSRPRPAGPPATGRCARRPPGRTMAVMTTAEVIQPAQLDVPQPGRYRISPAQLHRHHPHQALLRPRRRPGHARPARRAHRGHRAAGGVRRPGPLRGVELPVRQRGPRRRRAVAEAARRRGLPQPLVHLHRARRRSRGSGRCAASLRCAASPAWSRPASPRCGADGATLRASAQASIDRYDFGITAYRGLAARRLTVDLAVVAHREES